MKNYKSFWDNFNTGHYLNVLVERDFKKSREEIKEEKLKKEINNQVGVTLWFIGLILAFYYIFKALEVFCI